MKCYVILVSFLSVFVFVSSAPFFQASSGGNSGTQLQLGSGSGSGSSGGSGGGLGGLTNILSQIDLPGLLRGVNSFVKLVGVFCPPCSQILDNVIQNVTSTAFRVFGRAILQGGGLGGGRGGDAANSVNVVLPTFPPDEDDYEDEDETEKPVEAISSRSGVTTESAPLVESTTAKKEAENAVFTSAAADESNLIARRSARITREAAADQAPAESVPQPAEDLSDLDDDDQDRNKRFLPFGGGSSSGGSGNFLFDIIRLVAGSGATEESDEKANSPDGVDGEGAQKSADHQYSEGIPGPITRLLVIANRGVANLIQDLILRLAQTSERLVNFKARLITSLI
ncbi:uncharacterized protein LOC114325161 isoform X2 [Diabrotica virgifera virgifera]|uniref:Uncharacterized protein n=1 Tax=Diabrotica virgifera virgifera TaxID=50390 RepID=A0ABM5IB12_DIAVI|nr:uncharacterized protein LOC114325161 isoform X2 [Diabrotica virgifera virgifera]